MSILPRPQSVHELIHHDESFNNRTAKENDRHIHSLKLIKTYILTEINNQLKLIKINQPILPQPFSLPGRLGKLKPAPLALLWHKYVNSLFNNSIIQTLHSTDADCLIRHIAGWDSTPLTWWAYTQHWID